MPTASQPRELRVANSKADTPRVVLFGRLDDGSFVARRVAEDQVPYTPAWPHATAQVMVYLEPDEEQLEHMLAALHDGRLEFGRLQEYGGLDGGFSTVPV
ncbi:hypothetical protein [Ramlibacter rhizophilus]|uniref:Uncharacterized protein n=1 Tax=Ramlibacter rhizophilus TaxID=1781167 RepID=A0A4Z0BF76_9BURK|nr:hypothetical protein [Ramlibacter rhizophilus]TFY98005.1 hypothetical protein EZ242_16275 [Ramlibacter rhizophilus]